MSSEQKVLIAGAGPVGLLTALALAQHDIAVVVLEKHSALPDDRRAGGFHAPSVDMFEDLGILDDLLAIGFPCPVLRLIDPVTGLDVKLDMGVLKDDVRNPYMLTCTQPQLSKTALKHLLRLDNAEVLFEHEVVALTQNEDVVTATVKNLEGEDRLAANWLIGCDGAHSVVRKQAGIAFEGYSLPEKFFIVETKQSFSENLSDYNLLIDGADWRLIIKLNEEDGDGHLWRFVRGIAPEHFDSVALSQAYMEESVRKAASFDSIEFINHYTYRVHQRVAERFRKGRVLLAGDAAHINNPLGGQGLNAGIHDVMNLVPRLVRVIRGEASEDELGLYDRQRRITNIEYIQRVSIENRATMQETDISKRQALTERFRHCEADDAARRQYMARFAMVEGLNFSHTIT